MLMAKNHQGLWCSALEISQAKDDYFCPDCQQSVYLRKGVKRLSHFAHYQKCESPQFSEGETTEHLKGKLLLYQWASMFCDSVQLEAYIPELQQRPDILICYQGKQIALEFQCSPISLEQLSNRTQGYQNAGYKVIWIVGGKHAKQINTKFMYLSTDIYLIVLDVLQERVFLKSRYTSHDTTLKALLEHTPIIRQTIPLKYANKRLLRLPFLKWLYQERLQVNFVPVSITQFKGKVDGVRLNGAEWLSLLYILFSQHQYTYPKIVRQCQQWIQEKQLHLEDMPLITAKNQLDYAVTIGLETLKRMR